MVPRKGNRGRRVSRPFSCHRSLWTQHLNRQIPTMEHSPESAVGRNARLGVTGCLWCGSDRSDLRSEKRSDAGEIERRGEMRS